MRIIIEKNAENMFCIDVRTKTLNFVTLLNDELNLIEELIRILKLYKLEHQKEWE